MSDAASVTVSAYPLLGALVGTARTSSTISYAFAKAGESVDKSSYTGGSSYTSAWTAAEQNDFRTAIARIMEICNVTFVEVGLTAQSDVDLQMVDSVPGGWAGYAGWGTFVVGSSGVGLLTHELGHTLGLGHPFDSSMGSRTLGADDHDHDHAIEGTLFDNKVYTIMSYTHGDFLDLPAVDAATPDRLGALDIAALQVMYGANMQTRTGNDTYTAPQNDVIAIWDAGGIDLIDFSAMATDTQIDLRAATLHQEIGGGGFASVLDTSGEGWQVGGYTIAHGVTIENGIAGSGNDRLIGNDAANVLSGGMGDDTAMGGAGDDVIHGQAAGAGIPALVLVEMNDASTRSRALVQEDASIASGFTLDIVLRIDAGNEALSQRILSFDAASASGYSFDLQVWDKSVPYLYLIETTGSGYRTIWTGIDRDEIADGALHRLTLTRDAASGAMVFYLDGARTYGTTSSAGAQAGSGSLIFGQSQGAWSSGAWDQTVALQGDFGDIALYDAVLSAEEIAAQSITDLADTGDARLARYWQPAADGQVADALGGEALESRDPGRTEIIASASDDDWLMGNQGADSLYGGDGADTLEGGKGHDRLFGGAGDDLVIGGNGRDLAWLGDGDDVFVDNYQGGTDGYDTVWAGAGNDRIAGRVGADAFHGEAGNDTIFGRLGADTLDGGAGDDHLDAGYGDDLVIGGSGNDKAWMGAGNDTWRDDASGGHDRVTGGTGDDRFEMGGGNDTVTGSGGADTFVFAAPGMGRDVITDFTIGTDSLQIDAGLWSGSLTQTWLAQLSTFDDGDLLLDFGGGDSLRLEGVTSTAGLLDDITLI